MASLIHQGANFAGSEVVLIDMNQERLALVQTIAECMVRAAGIDLRVSATTDRRAGLTDCDAVLSSYRPGGFEARVLDESIPLRHGVIGQETQGPGGFFMALRAIHAMQAIVADMQVACPRARLFNYTNPINIVSQAVSRHTEIPIISCCEGPLTFPHTVARAAGLDPARLQATMVGLNHACWSVRHSYDGGELLPLLRHAYAARRDDASVAPNGLRMLELAVLMESIPADYFQYYYFKDEVLAQLRAKPTTRAQDIMAAAPGYWEHYRQQAQAEAPELDPARSRGGIHELELAIDVMDAFYNDRDEIWPVNIPNQGALLDFPDDLVVEVYARVNGAGVTRLAPERLPEHVRGLVLMLGEYQALAADAAWSGTRRDAVRALASHPLCLTLHTAEALYDELAAAHRAHLPERLLR
jgi:6-phospho-beta-glucosidase